MPRGAVPKDPSDMQQQLALRDKIYGNTIVYSVWERDRIDPAIAKHLARVKQCWVPCQQNAALLVKSGVSEDRVHVVPHPYVEDDSFRVHRKRPPAFFGGKKRFYSIGRWEPRKNFAQLIHAFIEAFEPGEATLTIKYSGNGQWPGYPTVEQKRKVIEDFGYSDCIQLIGGTIDRSHILRLHFENNLYVSASHGEAWALPAFDAKLAGNRLVYVPWGGVCDFASDDDLAVPFALTPADPSYRWEHGAQWASPSLSDLTEALRRAQLPEKYELPARFERFGLEAVGQKMRILVDAATSGKS
jgi:glycosyltransferase involved in cell wall biosynthesis